MLSTNKTRVKWFFAIEIVVFLFCLYFAIQNSEIFLTRLGTGCYIALSLGLMLLTGFAFVMVVVRKTTLHRVILFLGFGFGALSCLINTPGSIPDEPLHASNIYLWSNKLMLLKEGDRQQQDPVYIDVQSVMRRADNESASEYLSMTTTADSYRQILRQTNWFYSKSDNQLVTATLRDHSVSPIVYLPAIIGFTVARLLSLGYYPMLMIGRLMMLAFYIFAASWSIKKIPIGKMTLFVAALLPMSIHQAASLSYDAVILGLAMMTFAYIMYLAYGDIERIRTREWVTMLVLSALLAPCKVGAYLPIVLLLFLIPNAKLGGRRKFFWFFATIVIASLATCFLLNLNELAVGLSKTPLQQENEGMIYSMQWVLNHPIGTLLMMMRTVKFYLFIWIHSAVGNSLSWFSLNLSNWVITGFEYCLLLTTLKEDNLPLIAPTKGQRILFLLPLALCAFIFMFGMLVWWTPESSTLIQGVQGRYFIPMIPLVLFAIPQTSITLHLKRGERRIPFNGFSNALTMACVSLSCASLLNQVSVILSR